MRTTTQHAASVRRLAALPRSSIIAFVAAVALWATTGCSGTPSVAPPATTTIPTDGPGNAEATPPAAATPFPAFQGSPPAFSSAQAEFGEVVWTASVDPATNVPRQPVTWFSEEVDTIYAAIPALRLDPGAVVVANWTYNDTPIEGMTSRVNATASYVDAWIEFHMTRSPDMPWPTGVYQVAISVDGVVALVSEVEVRATADG
ncbi:MAG: hypothetical protein ACRDJW_03270 [Thermomicrobiales bacterium]